MSIIKRNGTHYNTFPGLFNDYLTKDLWNWGMKKNSPTGTTITAVNIKENKDSFMVEVAAPGIGKQDFKIELNGNILTITSEKSLRKKQMMKNKYTKKEFSYQSFARVFTLPKDVWIIEPGNS